LLANTPDMTLLDMGSWGLKHVAAEKDWRDKPTIGVEINVAGGRKMAALSKPTSVVRWRS